MKNFKCTIFQSWRIFHCSQPYVRNKPVLKLNECRWRNFYIFPMSPSVELLYKSIPKKFPTERKKLFNDQPQYYNWKAKSKDTQLKTENISKSTMQSDQNQRIIDSHSRKRYYHRQQQRLFSIKTVSTRIFHGQRKRKTYQNSPGELNQARPVNLEANRKNDQKNS